MDDMLKVAPLTLEKLHIAIQQCVLIRFGVSE